jgi:hypothetical protein
VRQGLANGYSPDQIAGRLKLEYPNCYHLNVSHETIYSALYAMPRGEIRRELMALLRQGHVHRWPRSRGANRKEAGFIAEDVLLSVRRKLKTVSFLGTGKATSSRGQQTVPPLARWWSAPAGSSCWLKWGIAPHWPPYKVSAANSTRSNRPCARL